MSKKQKTYKKTVKRKTIGDIVANRANRSIDNYSRKIKETNKYQLPTTGLAGLTGYAVRNPVRSKHGEPTAAAVSPYALGRLLELGVGTSLLMNYAPVVNSSLGGTLYHGTQTVNLPSILHKGLQTSYAGQAKRLNSVMLTSHIAENLSDALGRPLKENEKQTIADAYKLFAPHAGKGIGDALTLTAQEIAKKNGAPKSKIKNIGKNLSRYGQRTYFGYSHPSVEDWGRVGTEGELAMGRVMSTAKKIKDQSWKTRFKNVGHAIGPAADVLTGGLGSNVSELYNTIKSNRELAKVPTKVMDLKHAKNYIAKKYVGGRFFNKKNPWKYTAVLGVRPSAKELKGINAFSDFPVVGSLMSSNTGFRNIVKKFLPNYSPGRDISIPSDVSPHSIRSITLMTNPRYLEDGKAPKYVERVIIKNKNKESRNLMKKLKTVNKGMALATAGGALFAADALAGSKWLTHLIHKKRQNRNGVLKTAGLMSPQARQAILNGLKWGGLTAGGVLLLSGPYALAQHIAQKRNKTTRGILAGTAATDTSQRAAQGASVLKASGAALRDVSQEAGDAAVTGSLAGDYVGSGLSQQYNPVKAMSRQLSGLRGYPGGSLVPDKADKVVKRNATGLTLAETALGAGATTGAGKYVYDRFYSMPVRSSGGAVSKWIQSFKGAEGAVARKSMLKSLLPYILITGAGATGSVALSSWLHKKDQENK